MLDWEWLGIDMLDWPHQRLGWEMYRIEHLAYASDLEAALDGWLKLCSIEMYGMPRLADTACVSSLL